MKMKKTIVMTIHQPSSQMFYTFDRLLLLSSGQSAYFGRTGEVIPFFHSAGFPISLHYNPADFILEKVKHPESEAKLIKAAKRLGKFERNESGWCKKTTAFELAEVATTENGNNTTSCEHATVASNSNNKHHGLYSKVVHDNDSGRSSWSEPDQSSPFSSHSALRDELYTRACAEKTAKSKLATMSTKKESKWPTSMWTQVCVLTERNFIDSRARMLSKVNWLQTIILAIVAGLIWFQVPRSEDRLDDIRGWMFFSKHYAFIHNQSTILILIIILFSHNLLDVVWIVSGAHFISSRA